MHWWEIEIEKLKKDNINGATYLTNRSINIIKNMLIKKSPKDEVKKALLLLIDAKPEMASIYNFAKEIKNLDSYQKSIEFCIEFEKGLKFANRKVVLNAVKIIKNYKTILTHSFSSLVFDAILEAKEFGFKGEIICTESNPKKEGIELAKKLCKNGIKTTLIIDAAAAFFIKDAELFLVGADGVGSFGLIHKVGTYPIAISAKEHRVKVVSLAPTQKFWPKEFKDIKIKLNNPDEIAKGCFNIKNIYFDITPLSYINMFVTQNGINQTYQ